MKSHSLHILFLICLLSFAGRECVRAQGTAFTYQGQLTRAGTGANGAYDFSFGIYSNSSGGIRLGNALTNLNVLVSNGLFTTQLDFGNVFAGESRWLEISVRSNASAEVYTTLSLRQPLTPTPYAIHAATAVTLIGPLPDNKLSTNVALLNADAAFSGTVTASNLIGNAAGLTNVPAPSKDGYLFAYDSTTQYGQLDGTFHNISFDHVLFASNWVYSAVDKNFICQSNGLYLVQYRAKGSTEQYSVIGVAPCVNNIVASGTASGYAGSQMRPLMNSSIMIINRGDAFSLRLRGENSSIFPNMDFDTPSASVTITRLQ